MTKMNKADMRATAVKKALEMVQFPDTAEPSGKNARSIPVEVEGEEIWVEFVATGKQWYNTEKTKAFDPFTKQEEWDDTIALRKKAEERRQKKKAEKLARQQAKREQAKKNKGKVIIEQE